VVSANNLKGRSPAAEIPVVHGKAGGYVAMKSAQYFISNCEATDRLLINIEDIVEINTVDDAGCAVR